MCNNNPVEVTICGLLANKELNKYLFVFDVNILVACATNLFTACLSYDS